MKVLTVQIRNFKNLEDVDIPLNGASLWIMGKNGTGKSSFIQSIFSPLTGKEFPQEPVTKGQTKGAIRLEIGDDAEPKYIVEVKFSDKNKAGTLAVKSVEEGEIKSPRKFLERIVGNIAYDPFELVKELADNPTKAVKKLKEIFNLNFDDLDEEYKEKYEERTAVNRDLKRAESLVEEMSFPEYQKYLSADKINVEDITNIINKCENLTIEFNGIEQQIKDKRAALNNNIEETKSLREELEKMIKQYEEKIKRMEEHKTLIISQGKELQAKAEVIANEVNKHKPEELKEELAKAKPHNDMVDKAIALKAKKNELLKAKEESDVLTERLKEITDEKKLRIQNANIPIDGLEFSEEGGLLVNGLPLTVDQINTAKIIEIGKKLQKAFKKELDIMRVDASLLDKDTIADLIKYAQENKYQLFIEKVNDESEDLQISIVEEMV